MTILEKGWKEQLERSKDAPKGSAEFTTAAKKLDGVWNDVAKFEDQYKKSIAAYNKYTKKANDAKSKVKNPNSLQELSHFLG